MKENKLTPAETASKEAVFVLQKTDSVPSAGECCAASAGKYDIVNTAYFRRKCYALLAGAPWKR